MSAATTWDDLLHPGRAVDFFARREFPAFDPGHISTYSQANALWLAELSRLVYRHDIEEDDPPQQPARASFLEKAGLKQLDFFMSQGRDTQAMLISPANGPSFAVLVFRGTEQNIGDFLTDLETGPPLLDQSVVGAHQGFTKALDSVWEAIDHALDHLTCPVFYTGHSLGAALATLAASRRRPHAVYTFASPRVGNGAFVDSLGSLPVYRVVDDQDALTRLPPESLGFRHVGVLHTLYPDEMEPPIGWVAQLGHPPKPLADHAPVNYVDRI
jgi:hypothetical protein